MFDFNASLNDAVPVSPIWFSVDLMRIRVDCWWMPFVRGFFCVHGTDRVQ